eukprot:TRINITY_DN9679_c0_g1_i1.p1 TRINITY_DN9679_c0_g1~~TRINITY_DN9679_c0_g1_i1.p1  ORF type:complete len:149 (+),score=29.13 TRINITY_DN9679_c0_g1_i1:117-563(+)
MRGILDGIEAPAAELKLCVAGRSRSEKMLRRTVKMIREKAMARGVTMLRISAGDAELLEGILDHHSDKATKIGEGIDFHEYDFKKGKFIIQQVTGIRAAWNVGATISKMYQTHKNRQQPASEAHQTKRPKPSAAIPSDDETKAVEEGV